MSPSSLLRLSLMARGSVTLSASASVMLRILIDSGMEASLAAIYFGPNLAGAIFMDEMNGFAER